MWRTYNFILKNAESKKRERESARVERGRTGSNGSARKTVDKATRVPRHTLIQACAGAGARVAAVRGREAKAERESRQRAAKEQAVSRQADNRQRAGRE